MPKLMWDLQKKEGRSCLTKTNFAAHNRMCQNSAAAFFFEKKTHKHTRIQCTMATQIFLLLLLF